IKLRQRAISLMMNECNLDSAAAMSALEAAGWDLRIAIVMVKASVARQAAETVLKQSNYNIARAISALAG
ncbi:MAG: hypothetical protein M3X11_14175, partial [Acidobacteriota bacterium]|nr:hypothetical protein [Acidobacteriota bacterium]